MIYFRKIGLLECELVNNMVPYVTALLHNEASLGQHPVQNMIQIHVQTSIKGTSIQPLKVFAHNAKREGIKFLRLAYYKMHIF